MSEARELTDKLHQIIQARQDRIEYLERQLKQRDAVCKEWNRVTDLLYAKIADRDVEIRDLTQQLADAERHEAGLRSERNQLSETKQELLQIIASRDAACEQREREICNLNTEIESLKADTKSNECWNWRGDGTDDLESLTCPVLISAGDLREIIKARDNMENAAHWLSRDEQSERERAERRIRDLEHQLEGEKRARANLSEETNQQLHAELIKLRADNVSLDAARRYHDRLLDDICEVMRTCCHEPEYLNRGHKLNPSTSYVDALRKIVEGYNRMAAGERPGHVSCSVVHEAIKSLLGDK